MKKYNVSVTAIIKLMQANLSILIIINSQQPIIKFFKTLALSIS